MRRAIFTTLLTVFAAFLLSGCGKPAPQVAIVSVKAVDNSVLTINRTDTFKVNPAIKLKLTPGTYLFELAAPGYDTIHKRITLKRGEKAIFAPELRKCRSAVLIESEPTGAVLMLDKSEKGTTPLVVRDLVPGNYKAHLILPGYAKKEVSWTIKDGRPLPKIKVKLDSNTTRLAIESVPERAKVLVDDVPVGYTPFEGNFEIGSHSVKLVKKGYVDHIDQVTLDRNDELKKSYVMRPRPGVLKLVTAPAGAVICINGEKRGTSPLTLDLDAGKYQLAVSKDGYDPEEKEITISPAQMEEMTIDLKSATGNARFLIFPGNVTVKLNGKDMGKTPADIRGHHEINFKGLMPGNHVLELSHPQANPATRRINFKVEKGKLYQPENPIEIWIANCEVTYKDGRVEKGAIYYKTQKGIMFGPTPKIKFELRHEEIKSYKLLSVE